LALVRLDEHYVKYKSQYSGARRFTNIKKSLYFFPMNLQETVNTLKAASDPTRLRLLALLAAGEATVGELQAALEHSQPRVSRHLRILCEGGLAARFRDGQSVYYQVPLEPAARAFVSVLLGRMPADDPLMEADRDRMATIRRGRAREAWNGRDTLLAAGRHAGAASAAVNLLAEALNEVPGALGTLLDIGAGTGSVLCELAARADTAVGVDISGAMRVVARTRVREAGLANCTLRHGDMHALPFGDDMFDTVLLDQVLALTDRPRLVIREAVRVLRPRGTLLVLDRVGPVAATVEATRGIGDLKENQLSVMLGESGMRLAQRRELPGRVPGFALIMARAVPARGTGTYD